MASAASDFKRRRALAWSAFWKPERLWGSSQLSISTKVKLFNTIYVTILLYGCESWVISHDMESKINAFATSCYRIILNIKRKDHVPNTMIYSNDQHRASYPPCSKSPVEVSWAHPPSPRRRACQ